MCIITCPKSVDDVNFPDIPYAASPQPQMDDRLPSVGNTGRNASRR